MARNRHTPPHIKETYAERLDHSLIPEEYMATSVKYNTVHDYDGPEEMSDDEQRLWDAVGAIYLNPRFAPLMAESFEGLPRTVLYAGFHDILRDDALFYSHQLQLAGVPVSMYVDPEGFHGAFWYRAQNVGLLDEIIRILDS